MNGKSNMIKGVFAAIFFASLSVSSQSFAAVDFTSGSDGSDGALNITTSVMLDGLTLAGKDADGDGIYHFTTIDIAEGAEVTFSPTFFGGRPINWLASGDVTINGVINLNGSNGYNVGDSSLVAEAVPGPGGYHGGLGKTAVSNAKNGRGPGGGLVYWRYGDAGGAGFYTGGGGSRDHCCGDKWSGGSAYGNRYMLPMLGGSGGAGGGGSLRISGGGGAGGGAILIASNTSIVLAGSITSDGGSGGQLIDANYDGGGGGSGGSIRLMADIISGTGFVSTNGGAGGPQSGNGSSGYIKFESIASNFTGSSGTPVLFSMPGYVFLPANLIPIRVTKIGGLDVPENPRAMFNPADVVINSATATTVEIAGQGIPLGTVVKLNLVSETGETLAADSTPLEGTLEESTATASLTIPHGFSRFYVQATW